MRLLLTAVIVLLSSLTLSSQHIDSSLQSLDSQAKQTSPSDESLEDSLYRLKMERSVNEQGKDLDKFLADYKEYKEKEQRRIYIRIAVGIVFLAALLYGLARKRKIRKGNSN